MHSPDTNTPPRPIEAAPIAILLATYNGAAHLAAQIDSLHAQTLADWRLYASDDGSTDGTTDLIEARGAARLADISQGPRRGHAANFAHLLCAAPRGHYVAFCDQDDVWHPGKLERALAHLPSPQDPVLYCARTWVCGPNLEHRHRSALPKRGLSLRNALVQNVAAGNTIVLTPAAVEILRHWRAPGAPSFDWWCYLALAASGAELIYDAEPVLLYRQHGQNAIGENAGLRARLARARALRRRTFESWSNAHLSALQTRWMHLDPAARATIASFALARKRPWRAACAPPVHRQSWTGQQALRMAFAAGYV